MLYNLPLSYCGFTITLTVHLQGLSYNVNKNSPIDFSFFFTQAFKNV